MSKMKRVLYLAGILVLALVLLFGCARLFWGTTGQSGWYIRLNIGGPGSKAISVEEYDVTRVEVELFAPGESLPFYTLTWYAGDDPVSELIPVSEQGEYRIEVTHVGDDNGEPVEAKESTNFNIAAMVITVINVTPGAVGVIEVDGGQPSAPINLEGYWDFSYFPEEGPDEGPFLFYMAQTGSHLYCTPGDPSMAFEGTIDGSVVSITGELGTINATVSYDEDENEIISGLFTSSSELSDGEVLFVRSTFDFGSIYLSGTCGGVPTNLNTLYGHGYRMIEHSESVRFDVLMGSVNTVMAGLDINGEALSEGTFTVTGWEDEDGEDGDGEDESPQLHASLWMLNNTYDASGGTVVIDVYSGTHMEGTFNLDFPDPHGSHLSGWFNVNFDSSGQSYVEGDWQGDAFIPGNSTTSWAQFFAGTWTSLVLTHWNDELDVAVWFTLPGEVTGPGTYTMSMTNQEFWGSLHWSPATGPQLEGVEIKAPSTLTLEICDEVEHRMKGGFQLSFAEGGPVTLIGEFDVPFSDGGF